MQRSFAQANVRIRYDGQMYCKKEMLRNSLFTSECGYKLIVSDLYSFATLILHVYVSHRLVVVGRMLAGHRRVERHKLDLMNIG